MNEKKAKAKQAGVEKLTPARALIAELVRRYWVLGIECSLQEIQNLAWFLECAIEKLTPEDNPLNLQFVAHKYGPYSGQLRHLLNSLEGSYLHSERRIGNPLYGIWFDDDRKKEVQAYLETEAKVYMEVLEYTARLIDGFESPYGLELLATVDWLLRKEGVKPTVQAIREGMKHWPGEGAGKRKTQLFDDRSIEIALAHLTQVERNKDATMARLKASSNKLMEYTQEGRSEDSGINT